MSHLERLRLERPFEWHGDIKFVFDQQYAHE
jgi:hypothetical protein